MGVSAAVFASFYLPMVIPPPVSEWFLCLVGAWLLFLVLCASGFLLIFSSQARPGSCGEWFVLGDSRWALVRLSFKYLKVCCFPLQKVSHLLNVMCLSVNKTIIV